VIQLRNWLSVRTNRPPVCEVSYHRSCQTPATRRPIHNSLVRQEQADGGVHSALGLKRHRKATRPRAWLKLGGAARLQRAAIHPGSNNASFLSAPRRHYDVVPHREQERQYGPVRHSLRPRWVALRLIGAVPQANPAVQWIRSRSAASSLSQSSPPHLSVCGCTRFCRMRI